MRVFLDTNVLVAAYATHGLCRPFNELPDMSERVLKRPWQAASRSF